MSPNASYATEQAADSFFRSKLDPRWLKREQRPDFYVDYLVEMDDESGPSGEKFAVQLKGTRSPNYFGDELRFKMKTKHLAYYLDKSPEPTFLVVVDLPEQRGVWLFLQEYLRTSAKQGWRTQKSLTVRLPTTNSLDDLEALRAGAKNAVAYMRELRPGSVGAAAANLKGHLESLDDRFRVEVGHSKDTTRVTLHAQETVQGLIHFSTPDARRKFDILRASGKPMRFEKGELHLTGSRVFEEILRRAGERGIELHAAKRFDCMCSVVKNPNTDNETAVAPVLSGLMVAGSSQATVAVELGRSPIGLSFELSVAPSFELRGVALRFDYAKWVGQRLLLAPSFVHVQNLVAAFASGEKLGLSCEIDGYILFKGFLEFDDLTSIRDAKQLVDFLEMARIVCRHLDVNPEIPALERLGEDEKLVRTLTELIRHGQVARAVDSCHANVQFKRGDIARALLSRDYPQGHPGVSFATEEPVPPIFGVTPVGWVIQTQVTRLQLTSASEQRLAGLSGEGSEPIELQVQQSPETALVMKLAYAASR